MKSLSEERQWESEVGCTYDDPQNRSHVILRPLVKQQDQKTSKMII